MADMRTERLLDALEGGQAHFPQAFFAAYKSLGLTDTDAMLVLHIITYQQAERSFPSLDELGERMSLGRDGIAASLQRLTGTGLLQQSDQRASIRPLLERLYGLDESMAVAQSLFVRFEQEFGRLLSPLEYEQVMRWMDDDRHPEWLVVEALRESVMAGVFNFRYVDTILRDWARARIGTEQQLADYRKGRGRRADESNSGGSGTRRQTGSAANTEAVRGRAERVVPAAQPGKYSKFYELYAKTSGHGVPSRDKSQH